jgi:uncharacterized protein YyaL (SSP411 family)
MLTRFHDEENGGFWQASEDDPSLILRVKEDYDGAEPSGNSVAALGLLRLATLTDNERYRQAAMKTLASFQERLDRSPQTLPRMLQAVDSSLQEPHRVVISGDPTSTKAQALLRAAHSVYQPHKVVLGTADPVEPFARTLASKGEARAYLCTGTTCHSPTDDVENLRQLLH